jgi:hypothetical protein
MSPRIKLLAAVCALAVPISARAAVLNGGFEAGNLSGWSSIGAAGVQTASFGITPTVATYEGYIETTGNATELASTVVAAMGIPGSAIAPITTGTPTRGTGLWQNVTVSGGDVLTFDWNFISDELNEDPMYNDFAFWSINASAFLLASRNSSTFTPSVTPAGFDGGTGWGTQTYTFPSAGTYQIGFGTFNVQDTGHNSALLLDGVAISVPEPVGASVAMMLVAGAFGRRRRGG